MARFKDDPAWPYGIWQERLEEKPYDYPGSIVSNLMDTLLKIPMQSFTVVGKEG